ncbi:MAG: hypothetical protein A3H49_10610 [Nitrospirae bacterium RIFCSPLOWO2_02_FULL_62_14]|nr:MAG: hypothetical protein A3H49_10610 [Nitrospirae bacterium RIFCSPLOWO2_02_FULL_62_14]
MMESAHYFAAGDPATLTSMKLLLAAIVGTIGFVAAFYLLSRLDLRNLTSSFKMSVPLDVITFLLNLSLLFISLVALFVALAAFNVAREAGNEQRAALDASRKAIESVVGTAQKQQQLLDENLKIASAHLELVRQQQEEEIRRLAQKPKFEFALGSIPEDALSKVRIRVRANEQRVVELVLSVKNVGDATARRPILRASATPANVALSEHGQGQRSKDPNILQIGGFSVMDMPPYNTSQTPSRYAIDVFAPPNLNTFSIMFRMWGENAPSHAVTGEFEIIN